MLAAPFAMTMARLNKRRIDLKAHPATKTTAANRLFHLKQSTADAVVSKVESITRMKTDFLFSQHFNLCGSRIADCNF